MLLRHSTHKQSLSHRQIKRKRRKLNKQNKYKQKTSCSSNVIPSCHADLDPDQLSSHNNRIYHEYRSIALEQYTNLLHPNHNSNSSTNQKQKQKQTKHQVYVINQNELTDWNVTIL